jgi:hypothetical protein
LSEPLFQLAKLAPRVVRPLGGGIQADQLKVGALIQRVGGHPAVGDVDRLLQLARLVKEAAQLPQRGPIPVGQSLLFEQDPVFVAAGQQFTPVLLASAGQQLDPPRRLGGAGRLLQRRLELGHVGLDGAGIQLNRRPDGDEDAASGGRRRLEVAPDGGQLHAQVSPPGVGRRPGPEQLGQHVARDRVRPPQRQIGQQQAALLGAELEGRGAVAPDPQPAEHVDMPERIHGLPEERQHVERADYMATTCCSLLSPPFPSPRRATGALHSGMQRFCSDSASLLSYNRSAMLDIP